MVKRYWREIVVYAVLVSVLALGAAWGDAGFTLPASAQACWEGGSLSAGQRTYPIDNFYLPWGPSGGEAGAARLGNKGDLFKFRARYKGGRADENGWNCGQAVEAWEWNVTALRNSCEGRCSAIPVSGGSDGTCEPTPQEAWDLAVTARRCSAAYKGCFRDVEPGAESNPIEVGWNNDEYVIGTAQTCEPGVYGIPGAMCDWPVFYRVEAEDLERVELTWCEDEPEPPVEPPASECLWWEERYKAAPFDWMRDAGWSADKAREWILREKPDNPVALKIRERCDDEVEPPEPEPEVCRIVDLRVTTRYKPGRPSTGQSTTEIRDEHEEPCDG